MKYSLKSRLSNQQSQEVVALCGRRASPTSYPSLNELSGHHCVTVTPSNRALIIRLFIQNLPRLLLQEPPNKSSTFSFQHILHTLPEWSIKKKKSTCRSPAVSSSVTLPVAPWAGWLSGPCPPLLPGLLTGYWVHSALLHPGGL